MSAPTKEAGGSGGSEKRGRGGGGIDIFTPGDPARRVTLKWRRSIELCSHRVKGGDADRDVERCASEAPKTESTIFYQLLMDSKGKVGPI